MTSFKKNLGLVSTLIIFSLCFSVPLSALATAQAGDGAVYEASLSGDASTLGAALQKQGAAEQGNTGGTSPSAPAKAAAGGIAKGVASCSIGVLASQMIVSTVSKAVSMIAGQATNKVGGIAQDKVQGLFDQRVPTNPGGPNTEAIKASTGNAAGDLQILTHVSGTTGPGAKGDGDLFNGMSTMTLGIFQFPSLNAIGFCIGNEIIQYITVSTIQWINNGFKGGPVYITNTKQFFKGVADQELGGFVNGLAEGTLGINVCKPFKVAVLLGTLGGGTGNNALNCSLSQIKNNYNQFTNGNWNSGGFPGWFEIIQQPNNVYGATLAAQDQAYHLIQVKNNTALIDMNISKGFRLFDVCQDKSMPNKDTGKCTNGSDPIKGTAGDALDAGLNKALGAGKDRLNIATSFDQIVSALVNQLIKIALDKAFDPSNYGSDSSGSSSGNSGSGSSNSNNTYDSSNPIYQSQPSTISNTNPIISCGATGISYITATTTAVSWSSSVVGGSGNYTYSWGGDASGSDQNIINTYSTTGIKNASVAIFDNSSGLTSSANCSATIYPLISSVSCTASPSNGAVTWTASATGGSGNFAYSWAGDASGSDQTDRNTYTTFGVKTGILTVFDTSSTLSATTTCSTSI